MVKVFGNGCLLFNKLCICGISIYCNYFSGFMVFIKNGWVLLN